MKSKILLTLALSFVACFSAARAASPAPEKPLIVGSGGVAGVYYPAAGAIASLVNRNSGGFGPQLVVSPSTRASLDNVLGLLSGKLQLGLVQSDTQSQAANGQEFRQRPGTGQIACSVLAVFRSLHRGRREGLRHRPLRRSER
jgi:TRAP-type uncharacterized transport system substrate-binding protein